MTAIAPDLAAVMTVAVLVVGAATIAAMRRPPVARAGRSVGGGPLASLATWGGVLSAIALAARGKLAIAAIALVAVGVHAGVVRVRASRTTS